MPATCGPPAWVWGSRRRLNLLPPCTGLWRGSGETPVRGVAAGGDMITFREVTLPGTVMMVLMYGRREPEMPAN